MSGQTSAPSLGDRRLTIPITEVVKAIPRVEPTIRKVCSTPEACPRFTPSFRLMPSVLDGMLTKGIAVPSRIIAAISNPIDWKIAPNPSNTTADGRPVRSKFPT